MGGRPAFGKATEGSSQVEGADEVGIITVNLPADTSPELVADVYRHAYEVENGALQGQTTVDRHMAMIDFSGRSAELAELVHEKLGGQYDIDVDTGYAAFIDKQEYGYGSSTQQAGAQAAGQSPLRAAADRLRAEASATLDSELGGIRYSAVRHAGPGLDGADAGPDRQASGRASFGKATEGSVQVDGVHFSGQQRNTLENDAMVMVWRKRC